MPMVVLKKNRQKARSIASGLSCRVELMKVLISPMLPRKLCTPATATFGITNV
jgi:hypothetical protein